jgi:hypothetical protein
VADVRALRRGERVLLELGELVARAAEHDERSVDAGERGRERGRVCEVADDGLHVRAARSLRRVAHERAHLEPTLVEHTNHLATDLSRGADDEQHGDLRAL